MSERSQSVRMYGRLTDGWVFDSSYDRDVPLDFKLGAGQVKQGCKWKALERALAKGAS